MDETVKTFALVKNSICVNTILATQEFADKLTGYDAVMDCTDRANYGVGQYWTGSEFMSVADAIEKGII